MAVFPVPGKVSQHFGVKNSAYRLKYHPGTDYAAVNGTRAKALTRGVVRYYQGYNGGYGNVGTLTLGNGDVIWYAHLKSSLVKNGSVVHEGADIFLTDSTGWVDGPHLHLEYRIGGNQNRPIDIDHWIRTHQAKPAPKPSAPKRIARKGTATVTAGKLNVRNAPQAKGNPVASYRKGEKFNYDSYIDTNGYRWLSYVSLKTKTRRYIAQRTLNNKEHYVKGGV